MIQNRDILVKVQGVGKKFSKDLKKSLRYGLFDVCKSVVGLGSRERSVLRKDEFWAVRDVSFELRRGEVLGLIGHNGAGKSTLLKMLNGLIRPDEGSITMHGRVGALIELGTGFNPVLTGRENIYVNGQILGFSKKEIDGKLESIIDFSEIREFIDSPVQSYSSGMKVRLGFAVASQMEPDVLILDEVLAVGDIGFRGKCMKVVHEMMNRAAVIFVSHSMPVVNRYCNRAMMLAKGAMMMDTYEVQLAIDKYLSSFEGNNSNIFSSGQVELQKFGFNGIELQTGKGEVPVFDHAEIRINLKSLDERLSKVRIRLNFINKDLLIVASVISEEIAVEQGLINYYFKAGPFNAQPGMYKVSLVVFGESFRDALLIHDSVYNIQVTGEKDYGGHVIILKTEPIS